ncbi:MAG TPA: hypothetical protein VKH43_06685 [Thermoanaerobaculia bacterium]|nr:hypothetical protein [Thermoanaerobaculia bacterium]
MRNRRRFPRAAGVFWIAALFLAVAGTISAAGDVNLSGANAFKDLDNSDGTPDGVYNVSGSLTLQPGASILCNDSGLPPASACPISIVVDGDMTMLSASSILAENNVGGGSGGDISIRVKGSSFSVGPSALISSRKNAATDKAGAGDIFIAVGGLVISGGDVSCGSHFGDIAVDTSAVITADGNGEAGSVQIYAGNSLVLGGAVRAQGFTTTGRGGPIFLGACAGLGTAPSSVVSSRGGGPGADLVQLVGGIVEIQGLVESTGAGHQAPAGNNLCNPGGFPVDSTACVKVLSGDSITVSPSAEVNADTGFSGGTHGSGWIDFLSSGDIAINGDDKRPFALHANQGLTNGHGGFIQVRSIGGGNIWLTGKAIQANSLAGGGKGGTVTVEATFGTVDLGQSTVQANGSIFGGGGQAGGHVTVNAFLGDINGSLPGELDAIGGGIFGPPGSVSLNFCNSMNYSGLTVPGAQTTRICAF